MSALAAIAQVMERNTSAQNMKNYRELTKQWVLKRHSLNLFINDLMINADIICQQPKCINF
jgi:hypothetical protein